MTKKDYIKLVEYLRYLGDGGKPECKTLGICNNIHIKLKINAVSTFQEFYKDWEHFSGDNSCPIPHPSIKNAKEAYIRTFNQWNDSGYGDKRRGLCLFLADKIEEKYC